MIIAELKAEDNREIMKIKYRLKGRNCFIENDLTWEERQIQYKIQKWVKEEREKGRDVKRGYARVWIEGVWIKWNENEARINSKEKKEIEREKENNKGKTGKDQNFEDDKK